MVVTACPALLTGGLPGLPTRQLGNYVRLSLLQIQGAESGLPDFISLSKTPAGAFKTRFLPNSSTPFPGGYLVQENVSGLKGGSAVDRFLT